MPAAGADRLCLHVRAPDGATRRVPLPSNSTTPLLVGRSPDAAVLLESTAVSRHHAQLTADPAAPAGWRLRDLGSRNGTLVNGAPARGDVPLAPGDVLHVGTFELTLVDPGHPVDPPLTGTNLLLSDDAGGHLSTLRDVEPPRVSAHHLTTLNDLARDLLATESAADRRLLLCRVFVSPQFLGQCAVLLRLTRAQTPESAEPAPHPLCDLQRPPHLHDAAPPPPVSRTLLRAVAGQGEAVMASNVSAGPALPINLELSIAPGVLALAAVACPVRRDADAIDVLYVTLPPQCGTGEWLALASLAAKQFQQAEDAWAARARAADHAALERELAHARQIQLRLVPRPAALAPLRDRGVDVGVGFQPSHYVGGDYVDALPLRDGRVLLVLGDVCGHGLAAALVTSAVHTFVHAAVRAGVTSPRDLADGLHHHLCATLGGESFVTFVALALDPETGRVECVNAGHPSPVIVVGGGDAPRALRSGDNLPLGLMVDPADADPIAVETAQLAPGDRLLIFSDGLSEQADAAGGLLGIPGLSGRFKQLCVAHPADAPAPDLAAALGAALADRQAGRPPQDDQSFLIARRVPLTT